jgi:hypothetical protein
MKVGLERHILVIGAFGSKACKNSTYLMETSGCFVPHDGEKIYIVERGTVIAYGITKLSLCHNDVLRMHTVCLNKVYGKLGSVKKEARELAFRNVHILKLNMLR